MTLTRSFRFGAAWLLGMGLLISGLVVYGFVTSRSACDEESGYGFACDLSNIAVVIGAIVASMHLVAGASVWRGRTRGLVLGALIALVGVLGSASLATTELWWLGLPACAGYLGTSLVLAYEIAVRWGRARDPARP